jgi:hypothetical protein
MKFNLGDKVWIIRSSGGWRDRDDLRQMIIAGVEEYFERFGPHADQETLRYTAVAMGEFGGKVSTDKEVFVELYEYVDHKKSVVLGKLLSDQQRRVDAHLVELNKIKVELQEAKQSEI